VNDAHISDIVSNFSRHHIVVSVRIKCIPITAGSGFMKVDAVQNDPLKGRFDLTPTVLQPFGTPEMEPGGGGNSTMVVFPWSW
jgi:hypothetical protein